MYEYSIVINFSQGQHPSLRGPIPYPGDESGGRRVHGEAVNREEREADFMSRFQDLSG